jgi:hypothetical protein
MDLVFNYQMNYIVMTVMVLPIIPAINELNIVGIN